MRPAAWRLLVHEPCGGAWNMAVDEAILERYAGASAPELPTLRLYAWNPPALSLGRLQAALGAPVLAGLQSEGIELVRRPTGGAAVLHDRERTYAVMGRLRREPFPGGVLDTYRRIAAALLEALWRLGVDARARPPGELHPKTRAAFCFHGTSDHEIVCDEGKLVGSAQLRRQGAFLQHGSILLNVGSRTRAGGDRPVGIEDLLGRLTDPRDLDEALVSGFERSFGVVLEPGILTPGEVARTAELHRSKYATDAWTLRGRVPETTEGQSREPCGRPFQPSPPGPPSPAPPEAAPLPKFPR